MSPLSLLPRRTGSQFTLFQLQCLTHFDDIFAGSLQSGKLGDVASNNCRACNSSKATGIVADVGIRTVCVLAA